jgi:transmembrane sensor
MGRIKGSKIGQQTLDEAAEWFVEIDDDSVSPEVRRRFDEWLRRSPEHVRAFLELLPVWEGVASTSSAADPDAQRLIQQFLDARHTVVPLHTVSDSQAAAAPRLQRNSRTHPVGRWAVAAAASLAACGLIAWLAIDRDIYTTGVGEQRSLTLDDGSQLAMNARSRVRINFTQTERDVTLLEGQALFRVAKDSGRPFIVNSGNTHVRAVGTQFDVYRKDSGTVITVVEGRVSVKGADRQIPAIELAAGEQVTVRLAPAPLRPVSANVSAAIGWTQQRLTFQKTALADVADEFNRYNKHQLHVEGEPLRRYVVSGTFSSTDPASLLRFLRSQPGIRVIQAAGETRIVAQESRAQP